MNDFINDVIARSKYNLVEMNDTQHTYRSRFAPHLGLTWGKTIIKRYREQHGYDNM